MMPTCASGHLKPSSGQNDTLDPKLSVSRKVASALDPRLPPGHPCAHVAASGEYPLDQLRLDEIHGGIPRSGLGMSDELTEY